MIPFRSASQIRQLECAYQAKTATEQSIATPLCISPETAGKYLKLGVGRSAPGTIKGRIRMLEFHLRASGHLALTYDR